jgi:hypothetical protein
LLGKFFKPLEDRNHINGMKIGHNDLSLFWRLHSELSPPFVLAEWRFCGATQDRTTTGTNYPKSRAASSLLLPADNTTHIHPQQESSQRNDAF